MRNRQVTIDYLRGIAVFLVLCCHFSHVFQPVLADPIKRFGALGVQIFFVISGCVIPYSLIRSKYTIDRIHFFWAKRIIRLQLPFMVAMGLTFILSWASAHAKGTAPLFSPTQLFQSLFYLSIPGENPVIWSLIVELKYYLFISLFYPLTFSEKPTIRRLSFVGFSILSILGHEYLEWLKFLPYFLLGFSACYYLVGMVRRSEFLVLAAIASISLFFLATSIEAVAAVVTCTAIVWTPAFEWKTGAFFGAISYSLYLVHFPIGIKFINFSIPHVDGLWRLLLFPIAIGITVGVALIIYRWFEVCSSRWSQSIKIQERL